MSTVPKIDVHHHIIPPELRGNDYNLHGMSIPDWTVLKDEKFNESVGVRSAIYSVSATGVTYVSDPEESARVARSMNEFAAKFLPDYVPIWDELNRRKAVVFVHPINNKNAVYFDERLPMPAFDWPHETGRTAMDLILKRRLQQFPDAKIILSHGGGTLAALVKRATMVSYPEFGALMSEADIINQAKRFYFDLALSGSDEMLPLIMGFAKEGHLLFGSDFPHAPDPLSKSFTKYIDEFNMSDAKRKELYHGAALRLFPKLETFF